jgi:hypothetical protein
VHRIVADGFLVRAIFQKLRRSTPKRATRSNAVEMRLANVVHSLGEVLLRFREATRSSAFATADSSVLLVDVPDPTAIGEA